MKNGKVRVGFIGAGNIAQNSHLPAYLKQDDVELVAVCDINAARAKEVAQKHGMAHHTDSIDALVADDNIDAISICTWNDSHAEAAIKALKAGKHVLCEKPMAYNVEQAEAMVKAANEAKDQTFMMGFVYRHFTNTKIIMDLAKEGKFGDFYNAKATMLRRRGTPVGWFTDVSKSGGGPVIDIGVHVLDLTWYMMGKPKPVSVSAATYYPIGNFNTKGVQRWHAFDTDNIVFNTEDSAHGLIRFDNGATINFEVAWAINAENSGLRSTLYGTKAGVVWDPLQVFGEEDGYLTERTYSVQQGHPFEAEIRHFIDCVKTGQTPIATAEDGLAVQRILNGIYDSAKARKEVLL